MIALMKSQVKKMAKLINEKYVELLQDQIKQSGQWLIDNAEELVSKVIGITDFKIIIDLENGEKIPTIEVIQQNVFYKYDDYQLLDNFTGETER